MSRRTTAKGTREQKARDKILSARCKRVLDFGGDNAHYDKIPTRWEEDVLDRMELQGVDLAAFDKDDVMEALKDLGWYVDEEDTYESDAEEDAEVEA